MARGGAVDEQVVHLVDLLAKLVELGQAAELAVDPPGGVDLGTEGADGGGVDCAGGGDAGAEVVGRGGAAVDREAELGVGAAVNLPEQSPVLRQADGLVAVLQRDSFVLRLAAVMIGMPCVSARRVNRMMTLAAE